jgi:hypothetical protein
MKREQVQELAKIHAQHAQTFGSVDMGCKGCMHLGTQAGLPDYCTHWQDKVPAEHQAAGCDAWEYDEVPF